MTLNNHSTVRQKSQEADATAQELRQEMETLRSSKIDAERKLNEMEQSLRVCESKQQSSNIGSPQQLYQQQGQQQVHMWPREIIT